MHNIFIVIDSVIQNGFENYKKNLKNTVYNDKFRVAFQFMQSSFKFNVNNTVLTQELVSLFNLDRCSFEKYLPSKSN